MNLPNPPQEPLNNVDLESTIVGLRMTLTPEEESEARERFLEKLRTSPLAVPTLQPVPTGPDGAIVPNAPINLLIVTTADGLTGVPAFTTLGGLRAAIPNVENGMFLTGADLGNILGASEHKLFVTSPDMNVEVEVAELQKLALVTQQEIAINQQRVQHNDVLEQALAALNDNDSGVNQEAVIQAFLGGFCQYPVLSEADGDAEALVLSQENPPDGSTPQELAILTIDGALPAFTGGDALKTWGKGAGTAIALPGGMVAQLATQAEVTTILLNPGSDHEQVLTVSQGQVALADKQPT